MAADDLGSPDETLRRQLQEALEVVEVDVEAQWDGFLRAVRLQRRRAIVSRVAVAAAVLVVALTAGRPWVTTGTGAVVRFVSEVASGTVDKVAEVIEDRMPALSGGHDAHGQIDEDNPYWNTIRSVHEQLNDAVGWQRWEPDKLDGAATKLDAIVDEDPQLTEQVRSAADLISRAQRDGGDDAYETAVKAHRIIEQIETALGRRAPR
jgi:hypothetical protein